MEQQTMRKQLAKTILLVELMAQVGTLSGAGHQPGTAAALGECGPLQ